LRIELFSSTQFRNLQHDPVAFSPRVNLFVGQNGQGKTNILEALHFFQFGRSFRSSRDSELIRFGEPFCRIEVRAETARGDRDVYAASVERAGAKRIKVNKEDVGKYSKMVGKYPCVLFGPQDLALVSGYPVERRTYVDAVGSMTDQGYLKALRDYRRVLKQRNAAFKTRRSREALSVWTEELITKGCAITRQRTAVLDALRAALQPLLEAMEVPFAVDVRYESELTSERPEEVSLEEQFAASLVAVELEEIRRGVTLVGPHRDDIKLLADRQDLRRYGSQGQRRLMAVLLRLAELTHLEGRLREPCVLLLDDLFSELDKRAAGKLKQLLADDRQVFITSPVALDWVEAGPAQTFDVSDGRIQAG
jgi:DNA replication and repair protein RecF